MSTTDGTPGQRAAARAHVRQLRQDGGTYRSIAAAAALSTGSVHRLASGRRRVQPATGTGVASDIRMPARRHYRRRKGA